MGATYYQIEERFSRLFGIIANISPHSQINIRDLAKEFGVSERTIKRDLLILQQAKLGIYFEGRFIRITRIGYKKIRSWLIS
ncbi:MAG: DeoR family transcriptional regulator [Planctomycetes bacterium]|jgi:predicted DNA-binding transcriptional regulator YafY|nr:DeoR family transcriptional regulator [Planctomycetota bacterium]HPY74478.1 DeoR family transcriptional regulator [Planctomycetota bacterium]HQB00081.1 DeoR family transcriptional regulator [Planctomycetota bacterium]HRU51008.1 DeoR family transcriptional regulator [Planctomycetota bacterium]